VGRQLVRQNENEVKCSIYAVTELTVYMYVWLRLFTMRAIYIGHLGAKRRRKAIIDIGIKKSRCEEETNDEGEGTDVGV